jgi:hypothetical protein
VFADSPCVASRSVRITTLDPLAWGLEVDKPVNFSPIIAVLLLTSMWTKCE